MSKTKTKNVAEAAELEIAESVAEDLPLPELEAALEGRNILQDLLDWCGENHARVVWAEGRKGPGPRANSTVNVRVKDLQAEVSYVDPIEGLLEAVEALKARIVRRQINLGI